MFQSYLMLIEAIFKDEMLVVGMPIEVQTAIMTSVDKSLGTLEPTEAEILKRRFGLKRNRQTLNQVAAELGYPGRERVHLIEAKALRKLRHLSRTFPLRTLLCKTGLYEETEEMRAYNFLQQALQKVSSGQKLSDEELGRIKIDWIELSVRTANCFRYAEVDTLLDLKRKTGWGLLRVPNFGDKSLHEVEQMMSQFGITLANSAK